MRNWCLMFFSNQKRKHFYWSSTWVDFFKFLSPDNIINFVFAQWKRISKHMFDDLISTFTFVLTFLNFLFYGVLMAGKIVGGKQLVRMERIYWTHLIVFFCRTGLASTKFLLKSSLKWSFRQKRHKHQQLNNFFSFKIFMTSRIIITTITKQRHSRTWLPVYSFQFPFTTLNRSEKCVRTSWI